MKLKYFSLVSVLVLIFNLTGTGIYVLAEGTKPTIESMTIDNSDVTSGDSVIVSVKIKEFQDYRYLNLMYNAPGADQVITVQLDFNEQSGAYIGELPVTEYMKSGEYTPFSLAFYGSTVTSVDNDEVNLVEAMKFTVNGTSGKELIKSIEVDHKEAVPGEAVKISLKVSETTGIRYFNASFLSPITKRSLSISMDYNSDREAYEGVIPISSITESGIYKPFRVSSYGYEGNDISYSGSQYEELLQGGSFTVSGTDPGNIIDKIIINKQQLTVGEMIHFAVDSPPLTGVRYMNVNYTSPITGESFHVNLYHNNETDLFEGSMLIPEDFELGTYRLFMIAIYDEYNTTSFDRDEFQQLEQGDFTIYKDETPPAFLGLTVDKKQAEAGESVMVNVGASDNSEVHSAVIKYITPKNQQLNLDLSYDRNSGSLSGVLPIDKESEPGTWKVHSISIKDIHQNEVIVEDDATSLDNGDFTVIDMTPPSFPRVNEVTDQTTEVTGTAEASTGITVKKGTAVLGTGEASETGDFVIVIPQQAAGTELQVFAVDKAGNESEPAKTIVQDITAPSVPTVNEVTDHDTSVTGNAEDGATVEVKAGSQVIGSSTSNGSFTVGISKQTAGTQLKVYAIDQAGNRSGGAEVLVTDKTSPSKPIVNVVGDQSTSIKGKAEADAIVIAKIGTTEIGRATAASSGDYTISISKQNAGTEISVYAVDSAGNQGEATTTTVQDKTAPVKPTVNPVGDQSTSIKGKAEANASVIAKVGTTEIGRTTAASSGDYTISISKQNAGTEISVYAVDSAGNQGEATKTTVQDKTAPVKPTVNPVGDQSTSIKGKAEANASVIAKVGTTEIGRATAASSGDYTISISKQNAGTEISVYAVDSAGNQGEATKTTVQDKTAPVKPTVNPVGDQSTAITGQAEQNTTVIAKIGTVEIGKSTVTATGDYTILITKQKAGTEVSVYAVDSGGNQSEWTTVIIEDQTAPSKPVVNPVGDQATTITGKAEANSTVYASVESKEIGKAPTNHSGEFTISIGKQKIGTEISLYVMDQAGNKSSLTKVKVENDKPHLKPIIGTTRYSTAVEVSKHGWETSERVFLVNGGAIADGLTATPLAAAHDAPILLTTNNKLPSETEAELKRLGTKQIVLVGGTSVISDDVKRTLAKLGYNVSRIGGKDRYETSLLIAKQLDKVVDVKEAYLAYGKGEPDALSIAAQSGKTKQPIILTEKHSVPQSTFDWLKSEELSNAYFIGGEAVLDSAILKKMNTITIKNVEGNRISGRTRHDTNAKVMEEFYTESYYPTILIAKSETEKLVDALSAGPLASKLGVPVLIVSQNGLDSSQITTLEGKNSSNVHQIGGGINQEVVDEVLKYMD
ncbi:Ig-like domain-containing protein [Rossellomorea arthrocnemi]